MPRVRVPAPEAGVAGRILSQFALTGFEPTGPLPDVLQEAGRMPQASCSIARFHTTLKKRQGQKQGRKCCPL